jgi:ribosomal protein S27AE
VDNSKKCFKCGLEKALSEFYNHKAMADGHLNKCKDCTRKDSRETRDKNLDYYLEYDRQRANLPKRVETRLKYSQTPEGRLAAARAKSKWAESNLIKRAAITIVNNAVRDGRLEKGKACANCGKTGRLEAHHDDYAFPLVVRWLCCKCHREWHKLNGPGANAQ